MDAAGNQTHDADGLQRLLKRTEMAIAELEAQNVADDLYSPTRLPTEGHRSLLRLNLILLLGNTKIVLLVVQNYSFGRFYFKDRTP